MIIINLSDTDFYAKIISKEDYCEVKSLKTQQWGNFCFVVADVKFRDVIGVTGTSYSLFYGDKRIAKALHDDSFSGFIEIIDYDEQGNLWIHRRETGYEYLQVFSNQGKEVFCKECDVMNYDKDRDCFVFTNFNENTIDEIHRKLIYREII